MTRVVVRSPETPDELLQRADRVVDGPPGVLRLLLALADAPLPADQPDRPGQPGESGPDESAPETG